VTAAANRERQAVLRAKRNRACDGRLRPGTGAISAGRLSIIALKQGLASSYRRRRPDQDAAERRPKLRAAGLRRVSVLNAMIDKRPAPDRPVPDADDVARAIAFARKHSLPLAVRGGGHNGGGLGSVDDGIVIDLSPLSSVSVDPATRTVRVGGGAPGARSTQRRTSTAWPFSCGHLDDRVGGLTLGGGIGHLHTGGYGLTIDNLLAAQVVLPTAPVTAQRRENPGPVLALRGGGGNFGVVTGSRSRATR